MKAAFYTLGCKVNQNETAALEEIFRRGGYEIVPMNQTADVYVVNSCTVTAEGEAKSRRWLSRAKRQNPDAVTVLTGCFPQAFPESAAAYGADVVTGTAGRAGLLDKVNQYLAARRPVLAVEPHPDLFEPLPLGRDPEKTRAFVKVQDGCNRRCAYCAIPAARGRSRSRDQQGIVEEVARRSGDGCAEVVFTGINLPAYGRDTGTNLARLVEAVAAIPRLARIRLSSLDPDLLDPQQIADFAAQSKLCPHFHLSLQSGCDPTLRRMRRPYDTGLYRRVTQQIRQAVPGAVFTTDIIVGFPGETDDEFAQSLAFMREIDFLKVHVFPFSSRPGTPAAAFENQLPAGIKDERAKIMREQAEQIRNEQIRRMEGKEAQVLLEQTDEEGRFTGYTRQYIPALVPGAGHKRGDVATVVMERFDGQRMHCRLKENP